MQARRDFVNELCNMGFNRIQAENALIETNNQSVDGAVDWILQNANDDIIPMEEDNDYLLAMKLQQEEQVISRPQTFTCQLTNQPVPLSNLYITDECSHKFNRDALVRYMSEAVITQVAVSCPVCNVSLSIRDIKELMPVMPKQGSFFSWCCFETSNSTYIK